MKTLAIECSSKIASIAIFQGLEQKAFIESTNPKSHSEFINPAIDYCLEQSKTNYSELYRICVSIGPGSFTGVRVGIALAKTLSYSLNIPIFSINSLHLLSKNLHPSTNEIIVPVTNAQKNLVFWAAYSGEDEVVPPTCSAPEELARHLQSIESPKRLLGDGVEIFLNRTIDQSILKSIQYSKEIQYPSATQLGSVGISWAKSIRPIDWKLLHPLYIRDSEAEESLRSRQKVSQ